MTNSVESLRQELDEVDSQLLALVRKRLHLVQLIGQKKRQMGLPVFDRTREQDVLRKAENLGTTLGIPSALVKAMYSAMLEASHDAQSELWTNESERPRKVLIVGGRGKMGQFFYRAFENRGHSVDILDRDEPLSQERINSADVILVSVPMTEATAITTAIAQRMRKESLLVDINSLKTEVCQAMSAANGEAVGTHPMFGPTVKSLRRQKVVLCPVKPGPLADWFRSELTQMGAEIIESTPENHDKMMSIVQVFTHFGIMLMGRVLSDLGVPLNQTLSFMSPIYRLEISMIGRLFSQSPELYREIILSNPHGEFIRERYIAHTAQLAETVAHHDRKAFVEAFKDTALYFKDFSAEAMALSDHIIESIMARA